MFKLERALKTYREAGALNAQVNLLGFIDDHTFLTKGGDVGLILAVSGIDYECLASAEVDSYTKRLESPSKSSMSPAMPHGVTKFDSASRSPLETGARADPRSLPRGGRMQSTRGLEAKRSESAFLSKPPRPKADASLRRQPFSR